MKVAIHTVAKNEIGNVREWMDNARDADHVLMVDTGSDDGTTHSFKSHIGTVPGVTAKYQLANIAVRPWRFDVARNAALALLPEDIDCCITMDMDERLDPGWRDMLERVWKPGITTQGFYRYIFAMDAEGRPTLQFNQNRMHARHGFMWTLPAHEAPHFYDWEREQSVVMVPHMTMRQKQNFSVNRADRDLPLVALGYKENPNCQRAIFYYARQLHYAGKHNECIDLLNRYFTMGRTFPWEAAAAADTLASAWRAIGGHM